MITSSQALPLSFMTMHISFDATILALRTGSLNNLIISLHRYCHVWVTIDEVWIGGLIYLPLIRTTRDYTLQITVTHRLVS